MREVTEHERKQDEAARASGHRNDLRVERQDLRRLVPVDQYLDHDHLATLMHQGPSSNRPFLLWRHFAAVGMRSDGFPADIIANALGLTPAQLDAVSAPLQRWDVPEDVRRRFPLLYPELAKKPADPTVESHYQREDYPFVNTSGYRVMEPVGPGMRTRTLGGKPPLATG